MSQPYTNSWNSKLLFTRLPWLRPLHTGPCDDSLPSTLPGVLSHWLPISFLICDSSLGTWFSGTVLALASALVVYSMYILQGVATSSTSWFLLWSFPTLRLGSVSGSSMPGCCRHLRNHRLLGYHICFSFSCCCCFIFTSFSKLSVVVGLTTNQSSEWTELTWYLTPLSDTNSFWQRSEVKWSEVAQSCLTPCDPMDCSLPGFSVHEIFQARVLQWVAISIFWQRRHLYFPATNVPKVQEPRRALRPDALL